MVGDMGGFVHMIDAMNGKELWAAHMGLFPASISTGTPVLVGDKVIAPSSQYEIMLAAQDSHECCKIHGGVVALDAMTGKRVWEGHTMEQAKPLRDRGDGKMIWGPSGAPVWNSPSIDLKRNLLYVGTGEANSAPAHKNTNAIMAFDLKDGSIKWSHQATADDVYNVGCGPRGGGLNCPKANETVFRDVDFGASTIIAKAPNGKELVLAGQKSGTVWAMDPDTGKVVWRRDIGTGGAMGGVHWGIAADDTHVYAPISNAGRSIPGQDVADSIKPGLYAVNLNDGSIDWNFHVTGDCTAEEKKFVRALRRSLRPLGRADRDRRPRHHRRARRPRLHAGAQDREAGLAVQHGARVRDDQRRQGQWRGGGQRLDHRGQRAGDHELRLWPVRPGRGECDDRVQAEELNPDRLAQTFTRAYSPQEWRRA